MLTRSSLYKRITYHPEPLKVVHAYWRRPWGSSNAPEDYRYLVKRSQFLANLVGEYIGPEASILEIGCNVGGNLDYLYEIGYENLYGVEISENAIAFMRESFPDMANSANIYNSSIKDIIKDFKDGQFDLVFTMAVLEHIHFDSEWIFPEIARITKNVLVTIEDEHHLSWRHFRRGYGKIFQALGRNQIYETSLSDAKQFDKNYVARAFRK